MKKRIIAFLTIMVMLGLMLTSCGKEKKDIRVGVLIGPTGIGAVKMMKDSEEGRTENAYQFELVAQPTDIVAKLTSGELDIVALPTNLAANLYNKTNGTVQLLAINTLGVLYILENGDSVNSIVDLKGKTIYTMGQGSNPEYTLNYLLRENGLEPGTDVTVVYLDGAEVSTKMVNGDIDLCMMACPSTTTIMTKNPDIQIAVDVNEAWEEVAGSESKLTMGCLAVRKGFAEENPEAIATFLKEYQDSIDYVTGNIEEASVLVADYGITGNAEIAKKALPDCALTCITGVDMQPVIENYFQVLFDADPTSVGGSVPDAAFYYVIE